MQTDYKINTIETQSRKEQFSGKLDAQQKLLGQMKQQEDDFAREISRIKTIDANIDVVDAKVDKCLTESLKLDKTLEKLDSLATKTSQLQPEVNRMKHIEEVIGWTDKKLDKALQEQTKLDTTLEKLDRLNIKMAILEPELAKLEDIETTMSSFDEKQTKLISILLDAINKKKSREKTEPLPETTAPMPQTASASVEAGPSEKSLERGPAIGLRERIARYDEQRAKEREARKLDKAKEPKK